MSRDRLNEFRVSGPNVRGSAGLGQAWKTTWFSHPPTSTYTLAKAQYLATRLVRTQ
ncbi:hypothetical protein H4R35_003207, partial [Dimargaris xerosporica]